MRSTTNETLTRRLALDEARAANASRRSEPVMMDDADRRDWEDRQRSVEEEWA